MRLWSCEAEVRGHVRLGPCDIGVGIYKDQVIRGKQ